MLKQTNLHVSVFVCVCSFLLLNQCPRLFAWKRHSKLKSIWKNRAFCLFKIKSHLIQYFLPSKLISVFITHRISFICFFFSVMSAYIYISVYLFLNFILFRFISFVCFLFGRNHTSAMIFGSSQLEIALDRNHGV